MNSLCRLLIQIILLPVTSLLHWKMWLWFVTPIFGIAPPNKWLVLGLVMWVAIITHHALPDRNKKPEIEKWTEEVIFPFVKMLLMFGLGALYHFWGTT